MPSHGHARSHKFARFVDLHQLFAGLDCGYGDEAADHHA